MKRFLTMLTMALSLIGAYADNQQDEDENTRPMWGVKASLDINIPGDMHGDAGNIEMFRQGFGGAIGGVCNIFLGNNFYLEPGLALFYDTYSYKGLVIGGENDEIETDPSLYKIGIRIPVVAGYSFRIFDRLGMSVYTGPEFSYAFAGEIRIKNKHLTEGANLSLFGRDGTQRRPDCAWKIGVGFPMEAWFVSVDAAIGITNLSKNGMTFRENRCSVSLTRYF